MKNWSVMGRFFLTVLALAAWMLSPQAAAGCSSEHLVDQAKERQTREQVKEFCEFSYTFEAPIDEILNIVIGIETDSGMGTGFLVDAEAGLVLTSAEVVRDSKHLAASPTDEVGVPLGKFEAKLVGQDDEINLALLQVNAFALYGFPQAELALPEVMAELAGGDEVFAIGSPLAEEQFLVAGTNLGSSGEEALQIEMDYGAGFSGAPLIHVPTAAVIGVTDYRYVRRGNPVRRVISAPRAAIFIDKVRNSLSGEPPSDEMLSEKITRSVNLEKLRPHVEGLEEFSPGAYHQSVGPASLQFITPVIVARHDFVTADSHAEQMVQEVGQRQLRAREASQLAIQEAENQIALLRGEWAGELNDLETSKIKLVEQKTRIQDSLERARGKAEQGQAKQVRKLESQRGKFQKIKDKILARMEAAREKAGSAKNKRLEKLQLNKARFEESRAKIESKAEAARARADQEREKVRQFSADEIEAAGDDADLVATIKRQSEADLRLIDADQTADMEFFQADINMLNSRIADAEEQIKAAGEGDVVFDTSPFDADIAPIDDEIETISNQIAAIQNGEVVFDSSAFDAEIAEIDEQLAQLDAQAAEVEARELPSPAELADAAATAALGSVPSFYAEDQDFYAIERAGGDYAVMVRVQAIPKIQETTSGRQFSDSFERMELWRGGNLIPAYHPGRLMQSLPERDRPYVWVRDDSEANYYGSYTYPAAAFVPDKPVSIKLWLSSSPDEPIEVELSKEVLGTVWGDFETFGYKIRRRTAEAAPPPAPVE
ncbi:MAG: trypsin-like peptidase domain-containing protein [Gammaproteobacteria bacterium AqS3]|nr:trypsin-like peptidase domain-containing protein [Gammaproteobacteria bacterium AqS3]